MRVVAMIFQMESYHRCFFSTYGHGRKARTHLILCLGLFIFFCVSLCVTFAEAGIVKTVSQYIRERKKNGGKRSRHLFTIHPTDSIERVSNHFYAFD